MRVVIINKMTNKAAEAPRIPPGSNPVRLGSDRKCEVVLSSAYVGGVTGEFRNDVVGAGWEFINLNGRHIQVGKRTLSRRDERVPVKEVIEEGRVEVQLYGFVIHVFFDPFELQTEADDSLRLDQHCGDLVRDVHRKLTNERSGEKLSESEKLADRYIVGLEQRIDELSSERDDLPRDDLNRTALGDHLAGIAVRSALIQRLIAQSGGTSALGPVRETSSWGRLQTAVPGHEEGLLEQVGRLAIQLDLDASSDLTQQMEIVQQKFWPTWRTLLQSRLAPSLELRRYLSRRRLKEEIKDLWFGFGPLEDLVGDPNVTEIMVVDRTHIFIEKNNVLENSGRQFLDDKDALRIIQRIVDRANREINESTPLQDARMPDGSRVNAIIPPLALKGPTLTVRRFTKRLTIKQLIAYGSLTQSASDFLEACVQNRRNVLVAGGTGTGKTTMLNCLSSFIPDKERIVTIEDTAELQLLKEHVVSLQARPANRQGSGEVTIRRLVENALRMRPDRIVVGECRRGEDAEEMLKAMNTGHDGSMTTIHANSPDDVIVRLEGMLRETGPIPVDAIHRKIVAAIDLIVQLSVRNIDGKRKKVISEIAEVVDLEEGGGVRLVPLFFRGDDNQLRPTGHLASFLPALVEFGFVKDVLALVRGVAPSAG